MTLQNASDLEEDFRRHDIKYHVRFGAGNEVSFMRTVCHGNIFCKTESRLVAKLHGQIWEAEVRLSMMLMMPDTLSWYCGSLDNFFQTGEEEKPFQCCLCASILSPESM